MSEDEPDRVPDKEALVYERYKQGIARYLEVSEQLSLVQGGLFGTKEGLRTAYMWHVVKDEDVVNRDHPDLIRLGEETARFLEESRGYRPFRVALLPLSQLTALQTQYESAGHELDFVAYDDSPIEDTLPQEKPDVTHARIDILVGGLIPYEEETMRKVHETAEEAREWFRADEHFERNFGLHKFNKARDERTREMLKDITYVRNARIKGGMVRVLEMQGEFLEVLSELAFNPYTVDVSSITVLDVIGAIESGALRTS